ncbi:hypothetical protein PGB90_002811 [Kerria lacca]
MSEETLQTEIEKLVFWAVSRVLQFSSTKTCAMHFFRVKRCKHNIHLKLEQTTIDTVSSTRYLGMTIERLSWKQHIAVLIKKCHQKLNLIRKFSYTHYGAHQTTLLQLYNTLTRSVMD